VTLTDEGPNPLALGLERLPVAPTNLVIFGATGDLARRKLLPAIYNLAHEGALPERFNLVGVSRGELTHEAYRETAADAIRRFSRTPPDQDVLAGLLDEVRYVGGSFDDPAAYSGLETVLAELDEIAGEPMARAFYLSTAPEFFPVIVGALGEAGLAESEQAAVRVVIEKPFGTSLAQARELNQRVLGVFSSSRSSGSTTTSARRPCRTCSRSASPTGCSSRSGTATTSPTCRSPPPRTSASRVVPATTIRPAPCATSSRITCSSS
jgi:glucose-6-phosphate 1-dehydrogenase